MGERPDCYELCDGCERHRRCVAIGEEVLCGECIVFRCHQRDEELRERLKSREVIERAWRERGQPGLTWEDKFRNTIDAAFDAWVALDAPEDSDATP